jgi:CsoR family transcriptional regulator, copper-sensing transcriptional repressor
VRSEFRDGKLFLLRDDQERDSLLTRLRRIEGQVRGIQQMIDQDRYCGDELQQGMAVLAAMREVMRLLANQHVEAGLETVAAGEADAETAMQDIARVLRAVMRID